MAEVPAANATTSPAAVSPKTVRTAVIASAIGNATEWYDYGVFTSGAIATAIGTVFFPSGGDARVPMEQVGMPGAAQELAGAK